MIVIIGVYTTNAIEQAWCLLVTRVTVHSDGSAEFLFRGENRFTVK